MTSGTGLSSNVGGPQVPTPRELEASAATAVSKMLMGIMTDSLSKPVSQIDYDATWKYKSTSNNPTLAPMVRVRVSTASTAPPDESWTDAFNSLLDMLPQDLRTRYLAEAKLPPEQRSQAFTSMDNILGKAARFLTWLHAAAQPMDPAQVALTNIDEYKALPKTMSTNAVQFGKELVGDVKKYLNTVGHSSPNFDKLSQANGDLEDLLNNFETLTAQGGDASKTAWANLAKDLEILLQRLNNVSIGDDMQVIRPLTAVMILIAAAAAMENGAAPALLGTSLSSIGLQAPASPMGVMPSSIMRLIKNLSGALLATLDPRSDPGSRSLLPNLISAMWMGGMAASQLSRDKYFDLDLALRLMNGAGLIKGVSKAIAEIVGISAKDLPIAADIISCSTLLTLIKTVAHDNKSAAISLIRSLSEPLKESLNNISQFITGQLHDLGITDDLANSISVLVKQLKMALDEDNPESFLDTLHAVGTEESGFEILEREKEEERLALEKLRSFFLLMREMVGDHRFEGSDAASTGIVMA